MNELDRARRNAETTRKAIDRLELTLAREIIAAYGAARRDLRADLMDAYARLGDNPTPAQIRALLNQFGLLDAIDARLAELQRQFALAADDGLRDVTTLAYNAARTEINYLAAGLGLGPVWPFALDPLLELTIGPALEQIAGLIDAVRSQLKAALRAGLAQGQRMQEITKALYGVDQSIFSRGITSARLMAHRAVAEAENVARQAYLEHSQRQIPQLQKQAVAFLDGDTSETCLNVHGQIQDIDKPFATDGREAFARRQMQPPFHWGPCRTSIVGYHPLFEETSAVKTADMIAAAQAAKAK
jgi:hypothetical protein